MKRVPDKLQGVIEPIVASMGYEFVGLEHQGGPKNSLLRVFIDREEGITVDDCALVSRQISAVMDVEDPIAGHYTLEVSSPGLDRPLFTAEHFQRFAGSKVQVKLAAPQSGRRKFRGLLQGMNGEDVVLIVDDEEFCLPLTNIDRAKVIPEL